MLRADAFATLTFIAPFRRILGRESGISILMYHSVSNRNECGHPYYRTVTSPEVFGRQMDHLASNGYSVVTPAEVVKALPAARSGRSRLVAITFDDGYEDFYTHAFPILSKYKYTATVYLPTKYIKTTAQTFKGVKCLTWERVRELGRAGIEFGSHTVTHPQLRTLAQKEIDYEVTQSKETIEERLGRAVNSFAYPYAFPEGDRPFMLRLRDSLERAGYDSGVSTIIGTVVAPGDRFFLRRLPVNSEDESELFQAKLAGAYDWLHSFQYAGKQVKRILQR